MTQDTILVIEDDDAIRHTTVQVLEHAGFRVLTAKNGFEEVHVLGDHAARTRQVAFVARAHRRAYNL